MKKGSVALPLLAPTQQDPKKVVLDFEFMLTSKRFTSLVVKKDFANKLSNRAFSFLSTRGNCKFLHILDAVGAFALDAPQESPVPAPILGRGRSRPYRPPALNGGC